MSGKNLLAATKAGDGGHSAPSMEHLHRASCDLPYKPLLSGTWDSWTPCTAAQLILFILFIHFRLFYIGRLSYDFFQVFGKNNFFLCYSINRHPFIYLEATTNSWRLYIWAAGTPLLLTSGDRLSQRPAPLSPAAGRRGRRGPGAWRGTGARAPGRGSPGTTPTRRRSSAATAG